MHKRTLFILPVIAGVLCLAFPVVLEQLGTPRLLPDGVDSLLGMVGMTAAVRPRLPPGAEGAA